jgi:DNA repair photolyase
MTIDTRLQTFKERSNLLRKGSSKMFPFITKTWNPIKYCSHECSYGWCKRYRESIPRLHQERLTKTFKDNDFIFVCDCGDLFCPEIPENWISTIIKRTHSFPNTQFLFLTKAPEWARQFVKDMGNNCIIGATIESNRNYPSISKAPSQKSRINAMTYIHEEHPEKRLFVSSEPILDFDFIDFSFALRNLELWGMAIGYDNYNHHLPEPSLAKTVNLELSLNCEVYEKTLRKAWWEK